MAVMRHSVQQRRSHPHAIGHGGNMVVVDPQADDTVGVLCGGGNAVAVTLEMNQAGETRASNST